jgi:hypothetical protein
MTLTRHLALILAMLLSWSLKAQSIDYSTHFNELSKRLERSKGPVTSEADLARRIDDHREVTAYTRSLGAFLVQEIQNDRQLSGTHLNLINSSVSAFLEMTESLRQEALAFKDLGLDLRRSPRSTLTYLTISSVMTERFKTIQSLYFSEQGLRKILRDKTRFELYGVSLLMPLTRNLLNSGAHREIDQLLKHAVELSTLPIHAELKAQLKNSALYELVKNGESIEDAFKPSTFWSDRVGTVTEGVTRALSAGFGNAVGNIEWRTGHMHELPALRDEVANKLRPLDIIYEKRTFKLTDYTIPAHWGHLAVWLGTREELEELGLWDHPALDLFREAIERGENIYEVRRWGLQFDTLENFLNLDEFAITRISSVLDQSTEEIAQIYANLARQWTKKYDFTFNALATDRVTCTEIIFLSYGNINWPRGLTLGRTAITPDHMAELTFFSNSPMEFIAYYTARERHKVNRHTPQEFARRVGYVYRDQTDHYEKHHRICQNRRVRHHSGAIRMHMVCRDEYEHRHYLPPSIFELDFSFAN